MKGAKVTSGSCNSEYPVCSSSGENPHSPISVSIKYSTTGANKSHSCGKAAQILWIRISHCCIIEKCFLSPGPWCLGVKAAPKNCFALHKVANSSITADVISGPLSVLMIFGILLALIQQATTATKKWALVRLLNGSTLGTPNMVQ